MSFTWTGDHWPPRAVEMPRAVNARQDLPWQISGVYDWRAGLTSPLVGYCQNDDPRANGTRYTWL